ncbi:MAG: OadG family protein [Proteobacteria bacterium]|nr:OadG family protein [Pseudomonadota bacterium]
MKAFNWQNVIDGNGINISLTGMLIVFSGLLLITFYTFLLPLILDFFHSVSEKRQQTKKVAAKSSAAPAVEAPAETVPEETNDTEAMDIAGLIGLVLQLEQKRYMKDQGELITIARDGSHPSLWGSASKMRSIPRRRRHA